jgi:hypothetical protein
MVSQGISSKHKFFLGFVIVGYLSFILIRRVFFFIGFKTWPGIPLPESGVLPIFNAHPWLLILLLTVILLILAVRFITPLRKAVTQRLIVLVFNDSCRKTALKTFIFLSEKFPKRLSSENNQGLHMVRKPS